MRITRENLIRLAKETAEQRCRQDRGIVTVYLVGSLLGSEPMLGGTTDIDLVFIHDIQPLDSREFVALSEDILLDIAHLPQVAFRHPRELRLDPWLGSDLYANPLLLHDTQHWFEFTQAGARSQFTRPENVLARAQRLSSAARQDWLALHTHPQGDSDASLVSAYFKVIEQAANAIACLSGNPLAGRRFLLHFPARAQSIGQPDLSAGLVNLLGAGRVEPEVIRAWLPAWSSAYDASVAGGDVPLELHPARKPYFERGLAALLDGEQPEAVLWSLIRTWALAIRCLPEDSTHLAPWQEALTQLHLAPSDRSARLADLDAYLDRVEDALDRWGREYGA